MLFTRILLGIENSDRDHSFVSRFLFFLYSCHSVAVCWPCMISRKQKDAFLNMRNMDAWR